MKFYIPQDMRFKHRIQAFSSEPRQEYRVMVSTDGTVKVYDDTAGYYTLNHILNSKQEDTLRRKAMKIAKELRL